MTSAAVDTGHGGAIAFTTSSLAYSWRKIGTVENERGEVEDTHLGVTTYRTFLPGDVVEPGDFELEYVFDNEGAQSALTSLVPETITITFPIPTGNTVAANYAGQGFVKSRTAVPELSTDTLQVGRMRVRFNGKTGPNFTVGS